MTAPERIWAWPDNGTPIYCSQRKPSNRVSTEYVLAPVWHRMDDPQNPPPKDGTWVLITSTRWNGNCEVAGWHFQQWRSGAVPDGYYFEPTHWTPLPAPPEVQP